MTGYLANEGIFSRDFQEGEEKSCTYILLKKFLGRGKSKRKDSGMVMSWDLTQKSVESSLVGVRLEVNSMDKSKNLPKHKIYPHILIVIKHTYIHMCCCIYV